MDCLSVQKKIIQLIGIHVASPAHPVEAIYWESWLLERSVKWKPLLIDRTVLPWA